MKILQTPNIVIPWLCTDHDVTGNPQVLSWFQTSWFYDNHGITVKILKIRTPKKIAVITLNFYQGCFLIEQCIQKVQKEW